MNQQPTRLTGLIAVHAAVEAEQRPVHAIHADEGLDWRKLEPLRRLLKARGIALSKQIRSQLDDFAGDTKHGGVVAEVGPRRFKPLEALLGEAEQTSPWFVMLDGVEDPFNFGQAVRSLWAAGCAGLVVRPRNWAMAGSGAEAVIARASAGATEWIPMAVAESPDAAAEHFRAAGLAVVAADTGDDAQPLYEAELGRAMLLLIGGEKRGLKRSLLDQVDRRVSIPYGRAYPHDLGTVAAASVLGFEAARQRVIRQG